MKLLLVGGFLGAGKTTLISKLLPSMEAMGMSLALIENEFGEQSIDSVTLSGHQVNITSISGGCICCQLVGNLISALAEIEEKIAPNWCIIELSGMAVTANTLSALRQYYRPDLEVLSIVAAEEPCVEAMHRHVDFHETADKQTVVEKLKTLILEAGQRVAVDGIIPGHIKAIATMDGGSITASMTVMGQVHVSDLCEAGKTDGYAIEIYTFL